ncbi:MAG: hypothetical protein NTX50_19030 [Candidatus Sumerlaeota bacterium]|nr:hypothetical protein [Candidatus Sumerlaeota bacterium]
MTIRFTCDCGKTFRVPDQFAGKTGRCPNCNALKTIPLQALQNAPPPTPALPSATSSAVPPPLPPAFSAAGAAGVAASGGLLCAICRWPIQPREARRACPSCGAEYHEDCWTENKGCAIYGCAQAPETEHRTLVEIPVSYWGQEEKPCPVCGQTILAAAVRCRHCGATFTSARPESTDEYQNRVDFVSRLPQLKKTVIILFILCVLPCLAPVGAIAMGIWLGSHRKELVKLPAVFSMLCKLALMIGIGQTVFIIAIAVIFAMFNH